LQLQLAAGSQQNEELRRGAALLEGQALAAEQRAIDITHCIGPLLDEIDRLRGANRLLAAEREMACQEREKLENRIAASPAARLRALRHRLGQKWLLPFSASRVRR